MNALSRIARRLIQVARRAWVQRPAPQQLRDDEICDEFHLDLLPSTTVSIVDASGAVRQAAPTDGPDGLRIRLHAGETMSVPGVTLGPEHVLRLRAASSSSASVRIEARLPPATWRALATWSPSARARPFELCLGDDSASPLHLRLTSAGGDVELFELQVCARHRCGRLHALTSYAHRLRNEVQHFSGATYAQVILGGRAKPEGRGEGVVRAATSYRAAQNLTDELTRRANATLATIPATPGETAFVYTVRALSELLPMTAPNFFARARERSAKGPLSILSLCAGAARFEEQLLSFCSSPVRLTLLDASEELIQRAADRLSRAGSGHTVDCLIGDVNRGLPGNDRYDVIVCVSALHHVADLETVLAQTNERLVDDGEFWSIGEQIGRNGNRLWPDALVAANHAFAQLPERLRRNAHSGVVDATVSDHDFSVASFEGIRSEELETMLEAHFVPVHVFKRNAFLWRLVDSTYGGNFDLAVDADLAALRQLVVAEAVHWATGGRSTELHGVYRKKTLRAPTTS